MKKRAKVHWSQINDLIALHVDDMTLNNCEPKNILDTERKAKKHLGTFFAKHDFVIPLKKANIKAYKKHRVVQGAKPSTINRETIVVAPLPDARKQRGTDCSPDFSDGRV